jgi:hypothetical protein
MTPPPMFPAAEGRPAKVYKLCGGKADARVLLRRGAVIRAGQPFPPHNLCTLAGLQEQAQGYAPVKS